MIPVLTKEQAYKLDNETIESGHLSQEELMDNAGKAVAQFFCEKIQNPFSKTVLVVCGKGNNGGDGVIAYSYLKKYNVSSKIVFIEQNHGHSKLLKKYNISKSEYSIYNDKINFNKYDWIIDGVFGIGLSRDLSDKYIKIIKKLNENKNLISIDIPSGVFSEGADFCLEDSVVNSKFTITFGFPKLGHFLVPISNLFIYDIGFKIISSNIQKIEFSDIANILKNSKIKSDVNKFSKGLVSIIAGSDKYPGAAILASRAAKKTGSGYVKLFMDCSTSIVESNNIKNLEILIEKYYEDLNQIPLHFRRKVLIGPGIETERVERILLNFSTDGMYDDEEYDNDGEFIFDAGVLSALRSLSKKKKMNILDILPPEFILTPHAGEIRSMFPCKDNESVYSYSYIKRIQMELENVAYPGYNQIIIYKSWNTFIITKNMIYIIDKGPSLLATAGTGDVLSGILVSLLSQGYTRLESSILGTYLHAEAANYYMNNISKDCMTASDLIDCIPYAFNELRKKSEL